MEFGSGEVEHPDRGGRANLHRMLRGSPDWQLVSLVWKFFERGPIEPAGTVGGPMHLFLLAIHEFVTGEPASDSNRFEGLIKEYAKAHRRLRALMDELDELDPAHQWHAVRPLPLVVQWLTETLTKTVEGSPDSQKIQSLCGELAQVELLLMRGPSRRTRAQRPTLHPPLD